MTPKNEGITSCDNIIISSGCWSPNLIFEPIPQCSFKHAYINTDSIEEYENYPCIRDHDLSIYMKQQNKTLAIGGYEKNPEIINDLPEKFGFSLYDLDWDTFSDNLYGHSKRMPIISDTGITSTVCGPESFTPDHKPLVGEIEKNKWICSGFNSAGIMLSGGIGEQLSNWILNSYPEFDFFSMDIHRFNKISNQNKEWIKNRSHEAYTKNYSIVFPKDQPLSGRGLIKSPIHELIKDRCFFYERHGYEIPGYFLHNDSLSSVGETKNIELSSKSDINNDDIKYSEFGNDKFRFLVNKLDLPNYNYNNTDNEENLKNTKYYNQLLTKYTFDYPDFYKYVKMEIENCKKNVNIFDQSSFGKLILSGKDSKKLLQKLCTNDINIPINKTIYTALCNENGGTVADLTISRIDKEKYYIVTGGRSLTHNKAWIKKNIRTLDVKLIDITQDYGVLSIQGPKSGKLLEKLTELQNLENTFKFSTNKIMFINDYDIRAIRLTFVGQLGWELHIKNEYMRKVYEMIKNYGKEFNIMDSGYECINHMSSIEKYLHWHEDISEADTPIEAGIGFICKTNKEDDFIGKENLIKQKKNGIKKKLIFLKTKYFLNGQEPILIDSKVNGFIRRTGYDFEKNLSIGSGYIYSDIAIKKNKKWVHDKSINILGSNNELYKAELF